MTTTTIPYPNIPLPPGAVCCGTWVGIDDPGERPYRILNTPDRRIDARGGTVTVWGAAVQYTDGSIDVGEEAPTVHVDAPPWEKGMSAAQAAELAGAIGDVMAEMAEWKSTSRVDLGNVAPPTGAVHVGDWEPEGYRIVSGPTHYIDDESELDVHTAVAQFADGSIRDDGDLPRIHVGAAALRLSEALKLATALHDAAVEIGRWTGTE